jgi:hypothetical protein
MEALLVLAGLGIMISLSVGIWTIIQAIIFRMTKEDDRYGTVAAVFMFVMLGTALGVDIVHEGLYGKAAGFDDAGGWLFFPIYYALLLAGLCFAGLILLSFEWAFENLVELLRGK